MKAGDDVPAASAFRRRTGWAHDDPAQQCSSRSSRIAARSVPTPCPVVLLHGARPREQVRTRRNDEGESCCGCRGSCIRLRSVALLAPPIPSAQVREWASLPPKHGPPFPVGPRYIFQIDPHGTLTRRSARAAMYSKGRGESIIRDLNLEAKPSVDADRPSLTALCAQSQKAVRATCVWCRPVRDRAPHSPSSAPRVPQLID